MCKADNFKGNKLVENLVSVVVVETHFCKKQKFIWSSQNKGGILEGNTGESHITQGQKTKYKSALWEVDNY